MNGINLEVTEKERDIGVIIHKSMKPSSQCEKASRRASSVLALQIVCTSPHGICCTFLVSLDPRWYWLSWKGANLRKKCDLIQTFKILHGYDKVGPTIWYQKVGENPDRLTRATQHPLNIWRAINQECESLNKIWRNKVTQVFKSL